MTVGNNTILGTTEGRVITGMLVYGNNLTGDVFAKYLLDGMKNQLQKVSVGKNDSIGERLLTKEELLELNVVELQLATAEEQKDIYLIEQVLNKLRGKR